MSLNSIIFSYCLSLILYATHTNASLPSCDDFFSLVPELSAASSGAKPRNFAGISLETFLKAVEDKQSYASQKESYASVRVDNLEAMQVFIAKYRTEIVFRFDGYGTIEDDYTIPLRVSRWRKQKTKTVGEEESFRVWMTKGGGPTVGLLSTIKRALLNAFMKEQKEGRSLQETTGSYYDPLSQRTFSFQFTMRLSKIFKKNESILDTLELVACSDRPLILPSSLKKVVYSYSLYSKERLGEVCNVTLVFPPEVLSNTAIFLLYPSNGL